MVDHSCLVIAVWIGIVSGTKNTIEYAKRKGISVFNVSEGYTYTISNLLKKR